MSRRGFGLQRGKPRKSKRRRVRSFKGSFEELMELDNDQTLCDEVYHSIIYRRSDDMGANEFVREERVVLLSYHAFG
ncbi:hypothetical protein OVW21_26530, partial [Klebsiella pneumoniae]|uniref:hypothetical protein n=1 Tax=Klebsiella pneumoniae TaxID=573 RepID=UPI00226E59D0